MFYDEVLQVEQSMPSAVIYYFKFQSHLRSNLKSLCFDNYQIADFDENPLCSVISRIHYHVRIFFMFLHREGSVLILDRSSKVRLCLEFSDWFWTKRNLVLFKIGRRVVNAVWFWRIWLELEVYFSVCD